MAAIRNTNQALLATDGKLLSATDRVESSGELPSGIQGRTLFIDCGSADADPVAAVSIPCEFTQITVARVKA